ncbi:hypothetical protein Afil01_09920 [Actinorhabdospora filicis]|uniref:Thioredoxin domain-containing protein n=1 Tax=Actinorhabdospora filicis TaxID=1785913 RepID=A0A9W6SHQ2_9ACTN|nr:redoxin domain-containing protein [Actinorhabdospora filicis]GLZ76185.1 hypothetical protein Afil01_09920 [Actinorhabdospora filicis]
MIATLTAAVVLLAVLTAFLGAVLARLVKRVRELERTLSPQSYLPATGVEAADFAATDAEGRELSAADLSGETVVAMFAAGCHSCPPLLAELAAARAGREAAETLVFVFDGEDSPESAELMATAGTFARTARVRYGTVAPAFGVDSFPVFLAMRDRTITAAGHSPDELGVLAA